MSRDFHVGPVVKNLPSDAGDKGSVPGRGTKSVSCNWARQVQSPRAQAPQQKSPVRHS